MSSEQTRIKIIMIRDYIYSLGCDRNDLDTNVDHTKIWSRVAVLIINCHGPKQPDVEKLKVKGDLLRV